MISSVLLLWCERWDSNPFDKSLKALWHKGNSVLRVQFVCKWCKKYSGEAVTARRGRRMQWHRRMSFDEIAGEVLGTLGDIALGEVGIDLMDSAAV